MRLTILLIACLGLLLAVGHDQFFLLDQKTAPSENKITQENKKESDQSERNVTRSNPQNPYQSLQIASLTETRDRPLFTQSRKAPSPPKKITAVPRFTKKPQKKEAEYQLMGILKNGTKSIALLQDKDTGKYFRVAKGDVIGSNRITEIFVKRVKMEREDGTSAILNIQFRK